MQSTAIKKRYNKTQIALKAIMTTQSLIDQNLRLLYQTDYLAWYETTLALVKSGQRNALDLDSLGEVLEDLIRDTISSDRSYLKQIIIAINYHFLSRRASKIMIKIVI